MNILNQSYQLLDLLGRGSMGEVYRPHDRLIGGQVALKDKCYILAGLPAYGEKTL